MKDNTIRKLSTIFSLVFVVITLIITTIIYPVKVMKADCKNIQIYLDIVNNYFYDISDISVENNDIASLIRLNRDIMNNANDDSKSKLIISSFEEYENIADKINSIDLNDSSRWVRCYILCNLYRWTEGSIDETCDDYWHIKYECNSNVGTYNYAILIKYKYAGFLITNASSIIITLIGFVIFNEIVFMLFSLKSVLNKLTED